METEEYTGNKNLTEYMAAARNGEDWNARCDAVKAHHNGYPDNWFMDVLRNAKTIATMARIS